ncbi:MFS transporter [Burkholderia sp. Bp8994]|uniref:MFS transporter n=1 Tax=unclassified Burkholderia TaxID=2613784 RepID=UPI000F57955D|nr:MULTISPECIES: MFS transporter [unclassified Burkholderia]RQR42537.1 MFS transporter [Burkholderia sp. Bp9131]RQR72157.1 MFS transporter [Burkholderia sp. Bp9015]RQR81058.1 MFS transporter [Burkholderia sp. Bp9011]RQR90733.1 MFS transporter [Burkholderia sp. Bp9010]RQR95275.1 MFS transporter [Burkholderia sp. Bp8994]
MSSVQVRVLALFAIGYFVSYVFRGVNLGFAPFVTHELGLSAADLGLLTSLYFLGFAGAQIPAGVLLDHFGPRRVAAGMLLFAAAGAAVFGIAHDLGTMMVGRLLIGVGVSVCLGAAFKALAQHFPVGRLPLVNGLVMAVGGLGGVAVGSPLTWLLGVTSWRVICGGLAVLTIVVAAAIGLGAPEAERPRQQGGIVSQFKGTWHILGSRAFWKISSFSIVTQGVFYAMQSLWVGPYLRDVAGFDAQHTARLVSVLGFAMMAGCVGFGAAARVLERRGVSVQAFCGIGMALFVATQGAIVARVPLPPAVLWAAYGMFGGVGILTYAVLAGRFPAHLIGRANTTLTLVIFVLIFAFQIGIGAVLSHWPAVDGHYPAAAHVTAWSVLLALQLASAVWCVWPARSVGKHVDPAVR